MGARKAARRWVFLSLSMCALAACPPGSSPPGSEVPEASLSVISHVSVGSTFSAAATLECRRRGGSTGPCTGVRLEGLSVSSSEPSVIEVGATESLGTGQGTASLRALAAGTSVLTARVSVTGGVTLTTQATVRAAQATSVRVSTSCGPNDGGVQLYPVGTRITLNWSLYEGDVLLSSGGLPAPLDAGTFSVVDSAPGRLTVLAPSVPASTLVTSSLDPTVRIALEAFAPSSIDGVRVALSGPATAAPIVVTQPPTGTPGQLSYTVKDRTLCVPMTVRAQLSAAGPCALEPDGGTKFTSTQGGFTVYGSLEGPCSVIAALPDAGSAVSGALGLWFKSPLARTRGNWNWENPTPLGTQVLALGGSSPTDVWAAGEEGMLSHWDGVRWQWTPSGIGEPLTSLWSVGPSDVWAAGFRGALLHWDGGTWGQTTLGTGQSLNGLWARAANDVWVVGNEGTLFHFDGTSWVRHPVGTKDHFNSIWGTGALAWAGTTGGVYAWDGTSWSKVAAVSTPVFVHGSSTSDVWAVGATSWHWDGTAWTTVPSAAGFSDVFAVSPTVAFGASPAGLFKWNGTTWSLLPSSGVTASGVRTLWGTGESNVWAGGVGGLLAHYDGGTWSLVTNSVEATGRRFSDVWASGPSDVWAVGSRADLATQSGVIVRRTTGEWTQVHSVFDPLNAIWGAGPSDIWAAGHFGTVLHYDGNQWSPVASGTTKRIDDIWGTGPNNVWMVGDQSLLLHWNGTAFSKSELGACLLGCGHSRHAQVRGTAANDVWVVGASDWSDWDVWHYDGVLWLPKNPTTKKKGDVTGVWGSSPSDVWLNAGNLLHWNGNAWAEGPFTGYAPGPLVGSSATDVWAGNLHWDGKSWTVVESPARIEALFVLDAGHLWNVGNFGKVMRHGP